MTDLGPEWDWDNAKFIDPVTGDRITERTAKRRQRNREEHPQWQIRMKYDNWVKLYKPVKNRNRPTSPYDGYAFETYGEEREFVVEAFKRDPRTCWTLVTGDGNWIGIISGFHFVNRLYHFVTEIPCKYEIVITDV